MDDRRLIQDFLPTEASGKEASREQSIRKGHISTLHLGWARRPLVACRGPNGAPARAAVVLAGSRLARRKSSGDAARPGSRRGYCRAKA